MPQRVIEKSIKSCDAALHMAVHRPRPAMRRSTVIRTVVRCGRAPVRGIGHCSMVVRPYVSSRWLSQGVV